MANNNQNSETLKSRILSFTGDIFMAICRVIVKYLLWVAKHFWKRYFNMETPLYKLWWVSHARIMQKKLDSIHKNY